jgi:hypothetical protein
MMSLKQRSLLFVSLEQMLERQESPVGVEEVLVEEMKRIEGVHLLVTPLLVATADSEVTTDYVQFHFVAKPPMAARKSVQKDPLSADRNQC